MGEPSYSNPVYGVEQMLIGDRSGAINGTVAATELMRYTMSKAGKVTKAKIRAAVGGTEASVRQILLGKSLAGTGAMSAFGTQALGTLANGNIVDWTVTGTFAAGDDLVIQHLGTGAGVYDIEPQIYYQQVFVNA